MKPSNLLYSTLSLTGIKSAHILYYIYTIIKIIVEHSYKQTFDGCVGFGTKKDKPIFDMAKLKQF